MQPYFRMTSHNVHAGPQAIHFGIGQLEGPETLLAGASNAAPMDPAQHAVLTLTQITALLYPPRPTIYDLLAMQTFERIRQAIPPALARADSKLKRDHDAVSRGSPEFLTKL